MKVIRPRSTYGRKASCWPLLKRCTSSTNRMVCRPERASVSSAACMASRMSLTPENTADSATNSASKACAIRRARVVLPEPGGPHRIIECGLPDSNAVRSGLPGPSRCFWPTTSSSVRGRSFSASGGTGDAAPARPPKRSLPGSSVSQHVRALRRAEAEGVRLDLRIAHHVAKAKLRGLAEVVHQLHRLHPAGGQPQADALEAGLLLARPGLEPLQAV